LTELRDRLEQNRVARQRAIRQALESAADRTTRLRGTLPAGARVFDTVSGEEGEVVGGTVENLIVPTAKP
jgi:hypothetical protein